MSFTEATGGEITPEMRQLALQSMFNRFMPAGAPMEYSASKGFLPTDIGNYGQYTNIVQDWMDPTILNLILGASGLGQQAAPAATGRMSLEAIVDNTDGNSWEAVLAQALIDGSSPSQAIEETINFFEEFAPDKIPNDTEAWRESIAGKAETWFQGLVDDSVNTSSYASENDPLGLNSMGDVFQAEELNPFLADAVANSQSLRGEALSGMREDRMAALDARMGDTDKYMADAMASYQNQLKTFDKTSNDERRAAFEREQEKNRQREENRELYEGMQEQGLETGSGDSWIDTWGAAGGSDPTIYEPLKNDSSPALTATFTGSFSEQETKPLLDVMESEIRRDLSKARNNNAGKDYSLSSATSSKVNAAKKADERTFEEAARALATQNFYKSLGITPQSVRVNSVLRGGQSLFGN